MKTNKKSLLTIFISSALALIFAIVALFTFQPFSASADAEVDKTSDLFTVRELKVGDKFQEGSIIEIVSTTDLSEFNIDFSCYSLISNYNMQAEMTAFGNTVDVLCDINENPLIFSYYISTGLTYNYDMDNVSYNFKDNSTISNIIALDAEGNVIGDDITVFEKRLKDTAACDETPINPTTMSLYNKVIRIRRTDGEKITFADGRYHFMWGRTACPLIISKDMVYVSDDSAKLPFIITDYYIDFYLGYQSDVSGLGYLLGGTTSETENFLSFDFYELSLANNVEDEPSETPKDDDNSSSNDINDDISLSKSFMAVLLGLAFMIVVSIIVTKIISKDKKRNKR